MSSSSQQDEKDDGAKGSSSRLGATANGVANHEDDDDGPVDKEKRKRLEINFEPNEELLKQLIDMGISRNGATKALYYTGNKNLMLATNWIFDLPDRDLETPLEEEIAANMAKESFRCQHHHELEDSLLDLDELEALEEEEEEDELADDTDDSDDEDIPNLKMVFVVNCSLNMSPGKVAAQIAHAAVAVYRKVQRFQEGRFSVGKEEMSIWEDTGERMVVLKGDSAQHLRDLDLMADDLNLPGHLVEDAGLTEVPSGSVTAFAVFGEEVEVNKVTGRLKLYS